MLELKKTTKWDGKLKGIRIGDGQIVDGDGVIIDLVDVLQKAYGDSTFDLSTTTKMEEIIDLTEAEEVDIDELTANNKD